MGVLFIFFVIICAREHNALKTNESTPDISDPDQLMQPDTSSSVRYSATEYIIPLPHNVLYSISPRPSSTHNNLPYRSNNLNLSGLSNITGAHINGAHISAHNNILSPTIHGNIENPENVKIAHDICKHTNSNKCSSTGFIPIDNVLYPIYFTDDINRLRDILHSKYLPPPSLLICNSPNVDHPTDHYAVGPSYSTMNVNQMDKNKNQSVNALYKDTMHNINRDGLQNLQNEKYSVNHITKESDILQKTETERKPTAISNNSYENIYKMSRNNMDYFLNNPHRFATLKTEMTPTTQYNNDQFISEAFYPLKPCMVSENRNKATKGSEDMKYANNIYQVLQRNANEATNTSTCGIVNSSTPKNNQDRLILTNNQTPDKLFNTVPETMTEPDGKRQGQNNVQHNLSNPFKGCLGKLFDFNTENDPQKCKTIDNVEKHVTGIMPCCNEYWLPRKQVQYAFNGEVANIYNLPKNEKCTQNNIENKLCNENNRMYNTQKLPTGKKDSQSPNISVKNQERDIDLSMSNENLRKQIDIIKQRYILAHSSIQSSEENQHKHETIIDKNIDSLKGKVMFSEFNKPNHENSANIADSNQYYTNENRNPSPPIESHTNCLPTMNNKPNYTFSPTLILNELNNDLDSSKIRLQKSQEPAYMRMVNYNNNVPIGKNECPIDVKKQLSLQDVKAIYDQENTINQEQYLKRMEKMPSLSKQASIKFQNYDKYIPNDYKQEPLTVIQESSQKNYISPTSIRSTIDNNQNCNLIKNSNSEIKTYPEQEANGIFSDMTNTNNNIESVPLQFRSEDSYEISKEHLHNKFEISRNAKEFNLNRNSMRQDVPIAPIIMEPINQYAFNLLPEKVTQRPIQINEQSKSINTQGRASQNSPHDLNPIYTSNAVNTIQNKYGLYPAFGGSRYQTVNIVPIPIEPTVIQNPEPCTAKPIISEHPQVYTRVTSNVYDSSHALHNPDSILLSEEVKTMQTNPAPTITKPKPLIASTIPNTPTTNNAIAPNLPQKSTSYNIPITCNAPPDDRYTSLISSSLNNIASIIVTNLLSSLKKNISKDEKSFGPPTNFYTSPQMPKNDLPLVIPDMQPSLDVPLFTVIPPCVESPRLLPDTFVSNLENYSSPKQKVLKTSKTKNKAFDKKSFLQSITINVLPSVQQTSNEIIIFV